MADRVKLEGKQFGDLKVIEYLGNRKYECECLLCGNRKAIHAYSLTSGVTTSCGCKNRTVKNGTIVAGQKFGRWKALQEVSKTHWRCECACGKIKEVNKYTLLSGKSVSCGCHRLDLYLDDLTGKRFGEWRVIKYAGNKQWECQCSCGVVRNVDAERLKDGRSKSCGHAIKRLKPQDLTNKRFGKLRPVKYVGQKKWLCQCDCGASVVVRSANLINKSTISCGCHSTALYSEIDIQKKLEEYIQINNYKPCKSELHTILGVGINTAYRYCQKYNLDDYFDTVYSSQYEKEIAEFIKGLGFTVVMHSRNLINPQELDIYVPEKKLAIEINGDYWHSTEFKDKKYHQNKTLLCGKLGIQLIHIFEYEMKDENTLSKIKALITKYLMGTSKVYGRNTTIEQISKETADVFLNKYHMQGSCDGAVRLGCFSKDKELLGVMVLGANRFGTSHQYEIIRLCWKDNTQVIGGTQKLFKHFIKLCNPQSVLTYADLSKFTGTVYLRLGFRVVPGGHITEPGYIWLEPKSNEVLSRYQTQKHKLVKQYPGFADRTEDEIMHLLGYLKIYDSGNVKFEWVAT